MTFFTYDEIVLQLRAQGVPLEMAERTARRELGLQPINLGLVSRRELLAERALPMPELDADAQLRDAEEDAHVEAADKLVRSLGGHVIRNSQKRASKVTPGIPDRLYAFPRHARWCWWEAKSEIGKQSSAQLWFQEICAGVGMPYVLGPKRMLDAWLVAEGIARVDEVGNFISTVRPE